MSDIAAETPSTCDDRGKAQRKSLGSRCAIGESLTCHALPTFTATASLGRLDEHLHYQFGLRTSTRDPVITPQADCPLWLQRTKTACPLGGIFGLWCRDYCGETQPLGWWYPCGICIGGDL
jgi:hypothetical protein